ncbi:lipocalin-like domain-containing protein [Mesorhizobium caraganae]|uniref:lipocalin-like domain-containing protein n=1 Tax=Mesorhizobium caraganae TaxID=483206 RepID=UPI003ECD6FE6
MRTNLKIAILAMAVAVTAPAFAQNDKASIYGSWEMTSLQSTNADGSVVEVPYSGQVIFAKDSTLSVQAMDANPAAKSTTYTINGYEAYYGPVEVNEGNGTFAITVKSSLVRDLIGQRLERKYEVTTDQLVILPSNPVEGWRVTYKRQ